MVIYMIFSQYNIVYVIPCKYLSLKLITSATFFFTISLFAIDFSYKQFFYLLSYYLCLFDINFNLINYSNVHST